MKCGVGHDDAAPVGVIVAGTNGTARQRSFGTAIMQMRVRTDRGDGPRLRGGESALDLTKYSQPTHNASPFSERLEDAAIRPKCARRTAVTHVARAQVATMRGGITNAPATSNRLRV